MGELWGMFTQAKRCFDRCAGKWPMCNTSYSVHSYLIRYLAHDPSAKHNDLYNTDEQLLTLRFRIYALSDTHTLGWTVTDAASTPKSAAHVCPCVISCDLYQRGLSPRYRKKHVTTNVKSMTKQRWWTQESFMIHLCLLGLKPFRTGRTFCIKNKNNVLIDFTVCLVLPL